MKNGGSLLSKCDFSDKIKQEFFQAVVVSVLLYGWITWTLMKPLEKKTKLKLQNNAAYCFEQNVEGAPNKNNNCTATYLSSHKPISKKGWPLVKK